MAFGSFSEGKAPAPMADINVTPMVDVMLVLLVIFIITAPLFTHAIRLELPTGAGAPAPEKPETVTISIDSANVIFWNNEGVDAATLAQRMAAASKRAPQPELQLRADRATRYETVAQVMSAAQDAGLSKIGFVTDPKPAAASPAAPAPSGGKP